MRGKQTKQKEIRRVKLTDTQDLVASLVNDEKVGVRVFVRSDSYTGATRRGLRFYPFDNNWTEFRKVIEKVDRAYKGLA